ncbi:hypothetical protein [Aurantibacter aestuarii]|uniref:Uncharacterized protein n=1 Tax=Aurantibacter aestuarii TaxID=1266046 RepID=A0A2T1NCK6_9FLAO|nr:hypothetical protein [Aurantibacter aestuarii]PSG90173.1 hypothetical protein C7H52_02535 [Aurantibacter aestuarii]
MKSLPYILFFVSLFSFAQEEDNYKKNLNASLALIKKTVESSVSNSNTNNSRKKQSVKVNSNSFNTTKNLSGLIDIDKIGHIKNDQTISKIKVLETNGGKRKLIQYTPKEPKPISKENVKSLKAMLSIPK